eukprot:5927243-Prymnesium_polylepis.1
MELPSGIAKADNRTFEPRSPARGCHLATFPHHPLSRARFSVLTAVHRLLTFLVHRVRVTGDWPGWKQRSHRLECACRRRARQRASRLASRRH